MAYTIFSPNQYFTINCLVCFILNVQCSIFHQEKPYVFVKEGNFSGNERYEGFCIDLLKGIASQIGFQYTIRLVPDNMYGVYDSKLLFTPFLT